MITHCEHLAEDTKVLSPAEIATRKNTLRQTMRERLAAISPLDACRESMNAARHFLASPEWNNASSVYLFFSLPNEINTRLLLDCAWQQGKQVFLPKVTPQKYGEMSFYSCASKSELQPGPFGILEPAGRGAFSVLPGPRSLMIVPGLAFSPAGQRLGKGGGYYDRFFASASASGGSRPFAGATLIGLCFLAQLVDAVPVEEYDFSVHGVCTEQGILKVS